MRKYMKVRIELALIIVLGIFVLGMAGAKSQTFNELYIPVPSTPDISISNTATTDVSFDFPSVGWIYVRNDCSNDLYFDLMGAPTVSSTTSYPLRLKQNQSFSGPFKVYSLGVSPSSSASSCSFTLQLGR